MTGFNYLRIPMLRIRTIAATLFALSAAGSVQAKDFSIMLGFENVNPSSGNGVIAGADADVSDDWGITAGVAYHFSDRWSAELATGVDGFDHEVALDGLGTVATLTHRPTTVGVNYHFNSAGQVSPYLGVGYGWVSVSDETGVGALTGVPLQVEDANGITFVAGIDFKVNETFFIRASVRKLDFDSDVFAGGALAGTAEVDPLVFGIRAGLRF
jgi:outer membrane protein